MTVLLIKTEEMGICFTNLKNIQFNRQTHVHVALVQDVGYVALVCIPFVVSL